jgi:hypothetical protein
VSLLSAEEIVRGLVAQGVPREKAERQARYVRVEGTPPNPPTTLTTTAKPGDPPVWVHMPASSITLRIPWSALISDNAMYLTRNGKRYKTPEYRQAQKSIAALAADAMDGRPPAAFPLAIEGLFWFPNNHRRDVLNFGAALADSLKGIAFEDDSWIYRAVWERIAVDVDAPRCMLTLTPK